MQNTDHSHISDRETSSVNNPQVIFQWHATARPFKNRSPRILRFYLALCFLISVIVYFFGDYVLLMPLWAILFIFYVLTVTPPPEIVNKITIFGVESDKVILQWQDLHYFYFSQRFGVDIVTLVSNAPYYVHIYLIIPDNQVKSKVKDVLSKHLVYQENPKMAFSDKAINIFSRLLPED